MPLREDDVAPRSGVPDRRLVLQAGGFALAVAATLAVFLTDNPRVLRLAVVGVAWAFVLATVAAGRLSTERISARAREDELRRAYEHELDREVAARREYELELEADLRREAQESMRAELEALRGELAGLADLRDDVAQVADLHADLASLTALRDDVARVAALRDDVSALTSLRHELGQLAELRSDVSRLRQELTEQLSSEMLVERIVMRTQASRLTSDVQEAPGRAIDAATRWSDGAPPRELTGGWPAVRLDETLHTRHAEAVRVDHSGNRPPVPPLPAAPVSRPVPSPSWRPSWEAEPDRPRSWESPATASWEPTPPASRPWESPAAASWEPAPPASRPWESAAASWEPAPPASRPDVAEDTPLWSAAQADTAAQHARHGAAAPVPPTGAFPMSPQAGGQPPARPGPPPAAPPPLSPQEWPAARSALDAEPTALQPAVPPRRRRGDEAPADPAAAATTQRPALPPNPPLRVDDRGGSRVAVREEPPAGPSGDAPQERRLADILAENGGGPPTGGRRRRRYRDEDEPDDVLARVLGNT